MALNMTSFDAALKELYQGQTVQDMTYKNNPFFALVPKRKDFFGRNRPVPIKYGNPQGRSANFVRAQTRGATENSKLKEFLVTRIKDYCVATIDNETMEASKNDSGAFISAAQLENDGGILTLTRSAATAQYRQGYGEIGVIGSFATTTITLATTEDVTNFEVGQELVLSASVASNTLRALGGSGNGLIITGVNRDTGVLTFGFNVNDATNGIPTIANSDVIFVRGDREDSATPSRLKIAGLGAWIPDTAPTSTLFFGVDRSVDPTRLGGIRYDGSALPLEEAVINAASVLGREGGMPDHLFMHYRKWSDLENALGAKVQYADLKVGEVGFRALRINGPAGDIKVLPDQNCPLNRAYMLTLNSWCYHSLGAPVRPIDTDGNKWLRQSAADGVEIRWGYYANLWCERPGANAVILL
jgi:hypothetical protein